MANKRSTKGCVEIKVCIEDDCDLEIIKYQMKERAKDGKSYNKPDAASDLFMELLRARK